MESEYRPKLCANPRFRPAVRCFIVHRAAFGRYRQPTRLAGLADRDAFCGGDWYKLFGRLVLFE